MERSTGPLLLKTSKSPFQGIACTPTYAARRDACAVYGSCPAVAQARQTERDNQKRREIPRLRPRPPSEFFRAVAAAALAQPARSPAATLTSRVARSLFILSSQPEHGHRPLLYLCAVQIVRQDCPRSGIAIARRLDGWQSIPSFLLRNIKTIDRSPKPPPLQLRPATLTRSVG